MNIENASVKTGVIYAITCKINNKSYIGQAKDYKYKNGKPFLYSVKGRWNDHVSSSFNPKTPFQMAINKYGKDNFIITILKRCELEKLDAWEAATIAYNNTLFPNGYNIGRHSRVKNRKFSNIYQYYLNLTTKVEMKPIQKDGEKRLVYVYLTTKNYEKVRLTFGQSKDSSYKEALSEAFDFISHFEKANIPVKLDYKISGDTDPLAKYKDKINDLIDEDINKIVISKNKQRDFTLIVVYIFYNGKKIKIAFGGKTLNVLNSYNIAKMFVQRIKKESTIVEETNCLTNFLKSATGSCS